MFLDSGTAGVEQNRPTLMPDTAKRDVQLRDTFLVHQDRAFWSVSKAAMPRSASGMREALIDAQKAERDRLLYVAMTRAEKWLIVAAAEAAVGVAGLELAGSPYRGVSVNDCIKQARAAVLALRRRPNRSTS